jgi:hypothetical protein
MPDLGVHRVGEVDRGRARRQADDLALRREDVDLLRPDLEAQAVEELPGSAVSACQSEMWASQAMSVSVRVPVADSSRPPFIRCLYFQCAATPNSAR